MSYSRFAVGNRKCGLARWLVAVIFIAITDLAAAATYSLPSSLGSAPFSSCALVPGTASTSTSTAIYSCTDSISIGNSDTVVFTQNNAILLVNGNFSVGNNSTIDGLLVGIVATGNIDIGNSFSGSLSFRANGNFQAGNDAAVAGSISAGSNIAIGNNAAIKGNVNAGNNLSVGSGTISGTCTYKSTNYVCGSSAAAASFAVTPSTTIASSCAVAGGTPAAPWITITAKSGGGGSGSTVTGYAGTVTITGIGSGTLSKKTANGTLSGNRYTFSAADNGVALLYLTDPTAESVTPVASDGSASGTSSSAITFSDNVLVISDADTLSPTYQPVAGRVHTLNAAVWSKDASSGNCSVNTKINSTVASKIWMTTSTSHPSGAASPAVSTSAACAGPVTLPAASPGSTNISLTFSSGVAPFYLCTTDVGQYQVNVASTTLPGSASSGTSGTFTTVPFAIVVSDIRQGTTGNPGTQTANGTVFAKAGSTFQATVTAYRWGSVSDTNIDGLPDSGVLSTDVTGAATVPGYAQTVTLAAAAPIPSGGTTSSGLASGVVTVSGGSATVSTLSYPEVGSFTLSVTPVGKYLGQADLTNRVLIYATGSSSQNNVVGRFTPDHFKTKLTPACAMMTGGFTYSRQPFTVDITAVNAAGATTENYDTGLGFASTVTLSPVPATVGALSTNNVSVFTKGSASISERLSMTAWTAQTDVMLQAVDGAITSSGNETGANFRIGRVRLMNASGSERLDLPMTMRVEYWKSAKGGWVLNADDHCTGDDSVGSENAVTLTKTNLTLPTAAFGAMCAYDTGFPGRSGTGCQAAGPVAKQFLEGPVTGFAGNFDLNFSAPGSGNAGAMRVTANVPAWLQYKWTSTADSNPTATATFGQVKNSKVILRREMY